MESKSRPLGGIAALALGVASSQGAAPATHESGIEIPLLEDRSSYTETVSYIGAHSGVKHTLRLVTDIGFTLPDTLVEGLICGFVAYVSLNSLHSFTVGWSHDAAADRALRLVSCSTSSGERPAVRGCKEWVFESVDGEAKI